MASIKFIPQKLMNIALRLKRERIQKSHFSAYHKLTPVSDVPLGEYENAILYALSETDIRNIAITGVYGAGKSSLIKTFENKYKDNACFNFLNVSLASFVLEKNAVFNSLNDTTQNSKKNETQDIEKSLLQQIIYKVKSQELEDSQFSRIKIKRFCLGFLTTQFWFAFFLFSLIISISFVFKPTYFLFNESWLFKKEYATYFKVVVLIGVLGLIQLLLNWIPKLGLSKLSAGGAEISFNEKKGDSILNKHLDELIYFFATTRFNIVIFEDLDRLPNREILIKLREINQLINNSEEINHHGKNKIVKFVYALGDDLFTDPIDRTKFFDFIIPVIPIVNYSNSRKKLEDAIRKTFPKIDIQAQFLDEVTQFLDDMRLLFNISNEFIIYKRGLDANSDQSESKDKLKLDKGFLSFSVLDESQFAEKIIYCDDITDECYKLLINSIRIIYGDLSDLEVSTEKIKLLLDDEKFNLSSSNHEFLKTHLPYSSYVLIEQHFEDYLKDASKFSVLTSEFVNLIKISNLTSSQKLRLINTIPEEVIDEGLANAVFSFVLEETLEKPFNLDFIERAFNFNLSSSIKTKLFNRYAIDFNDSKIVSLVNTISSELSKLNEGRHSFIPKNEENLRLSNVLESRGFVSCRDYKKDPTLLELIPRKKIRK